MFSMGADSLLTSVPLHETVGILCDYIFSSNISLPIPLDYLEEVSILCTNNIQFHFEGASHKQSGGVAMGSLFGPILAGVFCQ